MFSDVVGYTRSMLGDGVNVASRIHALAAPGGVCVSGNVYDVIYLGRPGSRYFCSKRLDVAIR